MSAGRYEGLFDKPPTLDDFMEAARAKGLRYKAKLIKSGDMLELEIYPINPVWKMREGLKRAKALAPSRREQQNLNHINTRKRVSRLIHANFTKHDIWVTFEYGHEHMPVDLKEAHKHLKNYFKRMRRHIEKNKLPELKYIYVTERVENNKTGKVHTHHHIIMNFHDRDTAEKLWTLGGRTQARRLQPDDMGLEGLARYITKPETKDHHRHGAKTYATSKNLTKPAIKTSENILPLSGYRLSKRRIERMAADENNAMDVIANCYREYNLTAPPKVRTSDYAAGVSIYAKMIKRPNWVRKRSGQ
ncbi:MAG: hypothetical protein FWB87_13740 [Defluviitaleaceae bacterium]|nr:hypothetical protein [Defluviitaleaceae bacterium]